jgi:transposase InsO family protein
MLPLPLQFLAAWLAVWFARALQRQVDYLMAENRVLRERLGNKKLRLSESFRCRVQEIGIDEVLTAPRSPWQNSYAERIVGSIRRGCLDHVIVLGERHLRRILTAYLAYYNESRTHLSLGKDAPETRAVQPPTKGDLLELPQVGGLHHRYERRAA